jgi:hypothetical protein
MPVAVDVGLKWRERRALGAPPQEASWALAARNWLAYTPGSGHAPLRRSRWATRGEACAHCRIASRRSTIGLGHELR